MKPNYAQLKLAVAAGLLLASVPAAYAAPGTDANTTVTNTVDVDYTVGGIAQTTIQATRNFLVDRKVNVLIVEDSGDAVDVVPNTTENVISFTVTNETNDVMDFALAATHETGGTPIYGGTDNFDVDNLLVFVEEGTNPGYQPLEDLETFIDEIAAGDSIVVYVIGDVDAGQANGDTSGIILTATAAGDVTTSGTGARTADVGALGAVLAETNILSADNAAFVDTVFADTDTTDGNTAEDGEAYARGQYDVVTASIVVTKSSLVAEDPINGTTNPKAIPGATIEYCIDVENQGAVDAASISIADVIPANTTYVTGSIKSAATGTGAACTLASGTVEDDDTTVGGVGDETPTGGNFDGGTSTVTVITPTITAGNRFKATFRVTVD
jgi:uncharacterized repeat protein (TIGR01451 family)